MGSVGVLEAFFCLAEVFCSLMFVSGLEGGQQVVGEDYSLLSFHEWLEWLKYFFTVIFC